MHTTYLKLLIMFFILTSPQLELSNVKIYFSILLIYIKEQRRSYITVSRGLESYNSPLEASFPYFFCIFSYIVTGLIIITVAFYFCTPYILTEKLHIVYFFNKN